MKVLFVGHYHVGNHWKWTKNDFFIHIELNHIENRCESDVQLLIWFMSTTGHMIGPLYSHRFKSHRMGGAIHIDCHIDWFILTDSYRYRKFWLISNWFTSTGHLIHIDMCKIGIFVERNEVDVHLNQVGLLLTRISQYKHY